ncbi:uncharacterized protein EDB93DRAFT_557560 [Suillus bovinus]|uniref:uncharacterized protein n=1 Tax=Suillus bovinus TaxID=48563 RepID=UPI001B88336F|nr:uncharacterized protein EDB93DRAFT_557560 [Suillus bovinus]KAG2158652.1 hypothetical protein EDB93DRAFT_557560 [Suillus bovinus]
MTLSSSMKDYEIFMSTVQKPPEPEQSFEELRVKEYIKAYTATGRPPAPVPELPNTPNARYALGLPAIFSPIPIESTPSISPASIVAEKAITNPSDLPTIQVFQSTKTPIEGQFQSITAQPTFSFFSYEELRFYAYLSGNIMPPTTDILSSDNVPTQVIHPFYANDSVATAFTRASLGPDASDAYMSITASLKFDKHSFEELRLAYRLAGKELTSFEISTRGLLQWKTDDVFSNHPRPG